VTTHWPDPFLDTVALVRAAIVFDREAQRVLVLHGDPDRMRHWLLTFAKAWLLEWAGFRQVGSAAAVAAALEYLDALTASHRDDAA
jgi:hypothetical protein